VRAYRSVILRSLRLLERELCLLRLHLLQEMVVLMKEDVSIVKLIIILLVAQRLVRWQNIEIH